MSGANCLRRQGKWLRENVLLVNRFSIGGRGRGVLTKDDILPDDGHEVSLGPGGVHISGTGGGLRGGVGRHGQHRGRQHYCK